MGATAEAPVYPRSYALALVTVTNELAHLEECLGHLRAQVDEDVIHLPVEARPPSVRPMRGGLS